MSAPIDPGSRGPASGPPPRYSKDPKFFPAPPPTPTADAGQSADAEQRWSIPWGPIATGVITAVVVTLFAIFYRGTEPSAEVADSAESSAASKDAAEQSSATDSPEKPAATTPAAKTTPPQAAAPANEATAKPEKPTATAEDQKTAASGQPGTEKPDAAKPEAKPAEKPAEKPSEQAEPEQSQEKPETAKPAEPSPAAGAGTSADLLPIPDEAAQARAAKLIRDTYLDDFANADSAEGKSALARKLLRQAAAIKDDPTGRYTSFEMARSLASEASDAPAGLVAIDCMARFYQVDAWAMKFELLGTIAKNARVAAQHRAVAEQALALMQKAMTGYQFMVASRLNKLALAAAGKARDMPLIQKARNEGKEIDKVLAASHKHELALARLQDDPKDADANLAVGRYECLVKGNWEGGLPKLVLGSDRALSDLATKDLAGTTDADAQVAIADGWWDMARDEPAFARANLQRRAASWYQQAAKQATGLLKTKVEKRLDMLSEPPPQELPAP